MPDSKKKVALLSNITADLLISKLHRKYDFYQPEGYDTWVQEVINPSAGLYNFGADAVVVLLDGTEVRNWKSMEEGSGRLGLWKQAISTLVFNITTSPIFVSTIDIRENRIKSLSERKHRYAWGNEWYQFAQELAENKRNVYIFDLADTIWDKHLSIVFWEDFELKNEAGEYGPDILLHVVGENLGQTCGNILAQSYEAMAKMKPDALLVLGDTNSCLSAISAKRLHIPIFHMEAGNRCKDECLPEETNRRIVDVISDVNLPYSEPARKYLHEMGMPKERTYVTGSPMAEVLCGNLDKIEASDVLERLELESDKYILLSAHREENMDTEKNFTSLFTAVNALAEKYNMPILYSCHPRSRKQLEKSGFKLDPRVRVNEPLGFNDYNKLQMNALAVVSDSGTLPEESSFYLSIGHPMAAVCIRTSTERPEALESGNFILAGITTNELLQATDMAINMKKKGILGKPCPDYMDENVSMKVVRIIQGYVNVVNKMVWRKTDE